MDRLVVGDHVRTGHSSYSEVFTFTHKITEGFFEFVQLSTQSGHTLRLSPTHLIYLNGKLTAARNAKLYDKVVIYDGSSSSIQSIERVQDLGLFNPHTRSGNLMVNGILVSSYTTAVAPLTASVLLLPERIVTQLGQHSILGVYQFHPPALFRWARDQFFSQDLVS